MFEWLHEVTIEGTRFEGKIIFEAFLALECQTLDSHCTEGLAKMKTNQ